MKGAVVALLIIGTVAVTVGGVCFGIGMYNKANNEQVIENKYDINETFNDINIDLETANLYIKSADNDEVKVVCNDRKKVYQNVQVENNTLKIKTIDNRKWFEKWILPFNFKAFDVTIYLPKDCNYHDFKAVTATGDIDFEKVGTFNDVTIKSSTGNVYFNNDVNADLEITTSTGNLKLKDFKAKNVTLKSSTGNVNAEFVEVEKTFESNSSTGDQKLDKCNVDDLLIKTSTGNIKLSSVIGGSSFNLKTSTGNINFLDCDATTIKAKTGTGNIKGNLLSSHIFAASSDTGSVKVPKSTEGGLCELETDTGNIVITIG